MAGISLPAFWFGLLLQIVFAIGLGWLPSSGRTTPVSAAATSSITCSTW